MPKQIFENYLKTFVEVSRRCMSLPIVANTRRNVKMRAYWEGYIVPLKNVLDDGGKDFQSSIYSFELSFASVFDFVHRLHASFL